MAVSFSLVNGAGFASEASRILEDAWEPPTLRYSPGYLGWQLTFPSEVELPAVAAAEGGEPVGFAAATARRLRCGSSAFGESPSGPLSPGSASSKAHRRG